MRAAALYVLPRSSGYQGLDVDLWPVSRDARLYRGPLPVVAHPPCSPWSRKVSSMVRNDQGPIAHLAPCAVLQVRRYGGVLEHPADSRLWDVMSLPRPLPVGSMLAMTPRDAFGGFSVEVELGWWGSPLRKPTWLYFCGVELDVVREALPEPAEPVAWRGHIPQRADDPRRKSCAWDRMCSAERKRTPPAMAAWLADLASTAKGGARG
jgi:hypothetical protein